MQLKNQCDSHQNLAALNRVHRNWWHISNTYVYLIIIKTKSLFLRLQ